MASASGQLAKHSPIPTVPISQPPLTASLSSSLPTTFKAKSIQKSISMVFVLVRLRQIALIWGREEEVSREHLKFTEPKAKMHKTETFQS